MRRVIWSRTVPAATTRRSSNFLGPEAVEFFSRKFTARAVLSLFLSEQGPMYGDMRQYTTKLISADVCGTVMDSLSVQMAQVVPAVSAVPSRCASAPERSGASVLLGAQLPMAGTRRSRWLKLQACAWPFPKAAELVACRKCPCVQRRFECRRLVVVPRDCNMTDVDAQAAMAHARTPMQMMAAKQQLMAAKSRQVAERMQFNCF